MTYIDVVGMHNVEGGGVGFVDRKQKRFVCTKQGGCLALSTVMHLAVKQRIYFTVHRHRGVRISLANSAGHFEIRSRTQFGFVV